jgi:hypothetical protein
MKEHVIYMYNKNIEFKHTKFGTEYSHKFVPM